MQRAQVLRLASGASVRVNSLFVPSFIIVAGLAFVSGCAPTGAAPTTGSPEVITSTAETPGNGGMCAPCETDLDCGEQGTAECATENVLSGGHCAPVCTSNEDCGPGATCFAAGGGISVCYPTRQTCQGYTETGATTASAGPTTAGTSGTTGTPITWPTGATSTTTGTSGSACPGYAPPDMPAGCTCASGHTCPANNCYGGWYCELSDDKCVAPPAQCSGGTSSTTTTGSGTTTSGATTTGTTTSGTTGVPGAIGPHGGSVNLLHFAMSGDTRPPSCEDTANYPSAIINAIGDAEKRAGAQFALDLGDHMYVCNNAASAATAQMNLFMQGTQHFGGTWFMTEGNHECMGSGSGSCPTGSTNVNFQAFLQALAPISSTPYYSVNVQTSLGLATLVFIADNSWDTTQESWLKSTLAQADQNAKYTLVAKHHPESDSSISSNSTIMQIIRAHKFALLLTGHAHQYQHQTTDSGRDLILGNGGAPLISTGTFNGYAMVDQLADGRLQVSVYDVADGTKMDEWSVGPN
jgi:hypothetical protein